MLCKGKDFVKGHSYLINIYLACQKDVHVIIALSTRTAQTKNWMFTAFIYLLGKKVVEKSIGVQSHIPLDGSKLPQCAFIS